jgi:hypothetical protein
MQPSKLFFQHIEQHYDKLSKQLIPLFEHFFNTEAPFSYSEFCG